MSQEQTRRPQAGGQQEPIKYGDVSQVSGELANKPITPEDAAMMQAAETSVPGQTRKRGPAAVMEAAATRNERAGLVGHRDVTDVAHQEVVTIDHSEAAAIRAAECRATGSNIIIPGGLAATAQSAAAFNEVLIGDQGKIKQGEVLAEATAKPPVDKAATPEDAEGIVSAELRNDPNLKTRPGAVEEAVATAARINEMGGT